MSKSKPHFVFVGAFRVGTEFRGGVLYACQTLLASPIRECFEWALIDSTMEVFPAPPLAHRILPAIKRFLRYCAAISRRSVDGAIIFSSSGASFLEKGTMAIIAHWLGRRVVFFPISGRSIDDAQKSALMRWFMRLAMRRCDLIICQGERWKTFYKALSALPENRFAVIGNWIRLADNFATSKPVRNEPPVNILFLGWVDENKGIFDLIEVARRFRDELGPVRFIICGEGKDMAATKARVAQWQMETMFDFRGWVTGDAKVKALQDADIYVLLSYREGLPNALLEAMSAGCAVIATEVGAVPDVVRAEVNGMSIQPGDIEGAGRALVRLCHSPETRQALGSAAQAHIRNHHDINVVWPRVHRVLMDLVTHN